MAATTRVAFVLPSFAGGGAQKIMLTMAARLDRRKFTPIIVAFDASGPFQSLVAPGIEVVSLGRFSLRSALPVLPRALRMAKPDVIISTMAYVNIGLMLIRPMVGRHILYVLREANTSRTLSQSRLGRLGYRLAYRFLYPLADLVVCPAQYLADELYAYRRISRKKLVVLPNPVDEGALRAAADPPRRSPGDGRRFVAVGRLTAQKGYDRLLVDFAQLPADSRLSIFGEGELRDALQRQIDELGLTGRVALAGFEPQPAPWLAGADALLLPSRWEGLPNAALEALACGTPVIATPDAGGIVEIQARTRDQVTGTRAVTLANCGAEFIAAMRGVTPRADLTLRPSMLPGAYTLEQATQALEGILAA